METEPLKLHSGSYNNPYLTPKTVKDNSIRNNNYVLGIIQSILYTFYPVSPASCEQLGEASWEVEAVEDTWAYWRSLPGVVWRLTRAIETDLVVGDLLASPELQKMN